MKKTDLTIATDRWVEIQLKAIDRFLEEVVEPLADIGNPEKLIGKVYEEWTEQDRQMLKGIYGAEEPNILSDFVFNKEYEKVKFAEREV